MRLVTKFIDFGDLASAVTVTHTQKGDMVLDAGVFVQTAFNGTTPTLDIGFAADNQGGSADPNALASAISLAAVGNIRADELAATTNKICTTPDSITATFNVAGGTPTAGKGYVWVLIANDHLFNQV